MNGSNNAPHQEVQNLHNIDDPQQDAQDNQQEEPSVEVQDDPNG